MKTIVVDCNYLCYTAFYTTMGLSHEQKPTGVTFGFLKQILSIAKLFKTNSFIFLWDSRKSYRKLVYPDYKANRRQDKTPQEMKDLEIAFAQFTELREKVLPGLGFKNIFMQVGYEGDDLIAYITQNFTGDFIIISSDNDMWQLLENNVEIYSKKLLTKQKFIDEWGIEPKQWADVKALAGCNGDNVKGIYRVGEKTAVKYILEQLPEGKTKQKIEENLDIIKINLPLVKLPYGGGRKPIDIKLREVEGLRSFDFRDVFEEYNFQSFLREFDKWKNAFQLIPGR